MFDGNSGRENAGRELLATLTDSVCKLSGVTLKKDEQTLNFYEIVAGKFLLNPLKSVINMQRKSTFYSKKQRKENSLQIHEHHMNITNHTNVFMFMKLINSLISRGGKKM